MVRLCSAAVGSHNCRRSFAGPSAAPPPRACPWRRRMWPPWPCLHPSFASRQCLLRAAADHSVFVGDLAPDVTDYVLQEHFRQYFPSVRSAKVHCLPPRPECLQLRLYALFGKHLLYQWCLCRRAL